MQLRPYQAEVVHAIRGAVAAGHHPVAAIATGGGKSLIAATLAAQDPGRVLIVTHRKELLEQNGRTLTHLMPPEDIGYYSAGLESRDTHQRVIIGGVQSIYRQMSHLQDHGEFRTIIVDEAHACPPPSDDTSMYAHVFTSAPRAIRIGLSATPYRLDDGPIFGPSCWFNDLVANVSIQDLTPEYLKPLRGVLTAAEIDTSHVHVRAGEYQQGELSAVACEQEAVAGACRELVRVAHARHSWLVFCVDVAHTYLITTELQRLGVDAAMVTGSTPPDERAALTRRLRDGSLRCLVNCLVLTTGFDAPRIDVVAMMAPTLSKSRVVQECGRGSRLTPFADDCLILDFAGNIARHKPLDGIPIAGKSTERLAKEAAAHAEQARQATEQERQAKHDVAPSLEDPWSAPAPTTYHVTAWTFTVMASRNPKYVGKHMVQVRYLCQGTGGKKWVNHWLCPEYGGWASQQAGAWLLRHGGRPALTAASILQQQARLIMPDTITVRQDGHYDRLVSEEFRPRLPGFG